MKYQEKASNAKKHFQISLIKSGIRFIACIALGFGDLPTAAALFAAAEVLGIYEEIA